MKHVKRNLPTKLLLFAIILLAGFFRFYNLNWDLGHFFHPDERNIAMGVANITLFSQMDPKFYAYGGFLIYLYKGTADIASLLLNNDFFSKDWAYINVLGRHYSAFFSTLTLLPLFLLVEKLFSKKTAFITAALYALCVSSIQTAHFSITENILTLLLLLITLLAVYFHEKPRILLLCSIGILLGIGVATKTTGLSFFLIPGIMLLFTLLKKRLSFFSTFLSGILLLLIAGTLFTLFSPFTFLNWEEFSRSMNFENEVVLGINPVVYTLQFTGTLPYLFQLKNLFWQIGPVFLFSLFGLILYLRTFWKTKNLPLLLVAAFPIMYFLYVGSWHTKFIRYMVPLIPFFLILISLALTWILERYKHFGKAILILSLVISFLWTLAFFSIYHRPQTRIAASEWIYKNVEPGSMIVSEHWDEGLPIPLTSGTPEDYILNQLTIYEPDTLEKVAYYADILATADYVTITTRRLYGTLMHLPEKYPLTSEYYHLLFAGSLGYEKVAEFSSYPSLLGFIINDDSSEETFQVYDHPRSIIFKNTKRLNPEEIQRILLPALE